MTKILFNNQGNLTYEQRGGKNSFPVSDLEDGANFTKEFIIYKDEELLKVYSRKCDHNGGKLCKLEGKIACPLHGWEFNPESGSYTNVQVAKKEEDFYIDQDNSIIPFKKEVLLLPSEEELKSLVERTLTERDKDSVVKQNLNLVNEEMEKSYGTDASAKIQNKAKELGLTIERMQEIAAESPNAFFNLIGEPKKDFKPMVEGSVRTEGVNMQASNERDWSYYQNLRRDNRSLYYSPKIQRQLIEDKGRLGGKFGI